MDLIFCYIRNRDCKNNESFFLFSRINPDVGKKTKIYPLPHMYVVKDLVPVSSVL